MDSKKITELSTKIMKLQSTMIAFATDGRTPDQPQSYRELYLEVTIDLEEAKYANPNPHESLEVFFSYCKLQEMKTYASRRAYVDRLYADVLLDIERKQRYAPSSKNWKKANETLLNELTPVRNQWLKAKNFIYSSPPDFENSVKESISAVESSLMILLNEPNESLGKLIKKANLDPDIERIVSKTYGAVSNKAFVRHGGTTESSLTKSEAEFFLEFSAISILYISNKIKSLDSEVKVCSIEK